MSSIALSRPVIRLPFYAFLAALSLTTTAGAHVIEGNCLARLQLFY